MHHLDRSAVPAPACLSRFKHGMHNWGALNQQDRAEISERLEQMQGQRCAYCEIDLNTAGAHIEHFRQRGRYPRGTFEWDNLFWSCEQRESCGHYKDRCGPYNYRALIKPDVEDPERYFLFVWDGSIAVRSGLTHHESHRASETLRILNLDAHRGRLRAARAYQLRGYVSEMKELQQMADAGMRAEVERYIETEHAHTRDLPFCTAVKHVLTVA